MHENNVEKNFSSETTWIPLLSDHFSPSLYHTHIQTVGEQTS